MREWSGGFTEKYLYSRGKGKKRYDAVFKELARKNGLTQNEVDVILFLANNPSFDTARDIVEYRSMSKSHVCKSVESLSQKGLLSGRQDEEDRRVTHLLLTSVGRCCYQRPLASQGNCHQFQTIRKQLISRFLIVSSSGE